MPKLKQRASPWFLVAFVIALCNLAVAPFLLGGSRAPFEASFACSLWLGFGGLLLHFKKHTVKHIELAWGLPILVVTFLGLIGLIPWPETWFASMHPNEHGLLSYLNELLAVQGSKPVPFRASMAPALTAEGVLRWISSLYLLAIFYRGFQRSDRRELFFQFCAVLTLAVFSASLVHVILEITDVMGMVPRVDVSLFYAPLRNPNHLAKLYGLFFFINLLGARLYQRDPKWQLTHHIACGLSLMGLLFTYSRGGILFLILAFLVGLFLIKNQQRAEPTQKTNPLFYIILAMGFFFLGLGGLLSADYLLGQVSYTLDEIDNNTTKLQMNALVWQFLMDHPLGGAGLNALSGGLSTYFSNDASQLFMVGQNRIYYAENILFDLLGAFGFLGAAVVLAAWGSSVQKYLDKYSLSQIEPWAMAALFFVLGSEMVDFALVTPCILWFTLLILPAVQPKGIPTLRLKFTNATVMWVLSLPVILYLSYQAVSGDRKALDAQMSEPDKVELSTLLAGQHLHPFDANLSFSIAAKLREAGNMQQSLRWANYALLLWPTLDSAHIEAARALAYMGKKEQAALEYRLALETNSRFLLTIVEDLKFFQLPAKLQMKVVPEKSPNHLHYICNGMRAPEQTQDRIHCLNSLLSQKGVKPQYIESAIRTLLNLNDVTSAAQALSTLPPGTLIDGTRAAQEMRLLSKQTNIQNAINVAKNKLHQLSQPKELHFWLLDASIQTKNYKLGIVQINALKKMSLNKDKRFYLLRQEFRLLRSVEKWTQAYERILNLDRQFPGRASVVGTLLDVELHLSLYDKAKKTLAKYRNIFSPTALEKYQKRLDNLQRRTNQIRLERVK